MVELLGIVATIFVLISFSLSGEKNIRLVNMIGSILFVIYGIMLGALSVWLLNGILFFVHLYKLREILKQRYIR